MEYKVSDVKPAIELHTCRNCGHTFTGKVCNQCGEKVFDEKQLSTKNFIHQTFDFFLHWESKLLKSIKLNFIRPGFITQENLRGVSVPYAKPIQLYLVVAVAFYLIVSKVGVTDYIPSFGDHHYFTLSGYAPLKWTEPLDTKVINGIDSMWTRKGRTMEAGISANLNDDIQPDGSLKLMKRGNADSLIVPKDKVPAYTFNLMKTTRWDTFHNKVGTFGKTLIFVLLPFFAAFFFLFFFKKIKYYGAALILSTHFMVYNLCFYALVAVISIWPAQLFGWSEKNWIMKPFDLIFYNQYSLPISETIFGGEFEFMHLLFWMPWLFITFKRLFNTIWWKNLLISYFCSRVFFFLIFGVLKKLLIAFTLWTMH